MSTMEKRERIYIVFHWAGLIFAFAVLMIFGMGFAVPSARGLTQVLGIALVVAGVVALIQSNENLRGIEILGARSIAVPAGEEAVIELTVRNTLDRERIGLWVREKRYWREGWRRRPRLATWVPILEANETKVVRLKVPTARRGRYPVPTLWVCSVMPVGLCFAWKTFADNGEYLVYPAPRGRPLGEVAGSGEELSGRDGEESQDVSGHRAYMPGDALSRLDWRVFARTGNLVVRSMEEGAGDEVVIRWRDTDSLHDTERRLEQISFWVTQCQLEGRTFQLQLPHRTDLGSENLAACHEALALFEEKT